MEQHSPNKSVEHSDNKLKTKHGLEDILASTLDFAKVWHARADEPVKTMEIDISDSLTDYEKDFLQNIQQHFRIRARHPDWRPRSPSPDRRNDKVGDPSLAAKQSQLPSPVHQPHPPQFKQQLDVQPMVQDPIPRPPGPGPHSPSIAQQVHPALLDQGLNLPPVVNQPHSPPPAQQIDHRVIAERKAKYLQALRELDEVRKHLAHFGNGLTENQRVDFDAQEALLALEKFKAALLLHEVQNDNYSNNSVHYSHFQLVHTENGKSHREYSRLMKRVASMEAQIVELRTIVTGLQVNNGYDV